MVPVVDLSRLGRELAGPLAEAAARVASSGRFLLGDETAAFESSFAHWLGADDAVTVSSGAGALQLALAGLGIGPGDEVIVPAFTAVPTASAVCAVGATPVAVDVDTGSACLDESRIEPARSSRTRAVIVVHLYGRPATRPETDLLVIEDAAQAHGAIHDHARSDAVVYSFYPTKNLGGIGDGGAVVTPHTELAQTVRRIRTHGMTGEYVHEDISQNFRMSEIEAAWLQVRLAGLHRDTERRRAIAAHYRSAAPDLRWQDAHIDHVHHLAVFRATDRIAARETLCDVGIATAVHYPLALTQQPAFAELFAVPCPAAEAWARECVTVPCFPELSDNEVEQVAVGIVQGLSVIAQPPVERLSGVSAMFPCYNDATTIGGLVDSVHEALSPLVDDLEVIVVNDGSQDGSGEVLDELAASRPWLRVIHHDRNRGYGGALISGFNAAQHEWVFYTDGDAQYDAAEAALLVPLATDDVDIVQGYKLGRGDPLHRKIIGRVYHHAVKLLFRLPVRDTDCDFRLFRRKLLIDRPLVSTSGVICVEMMRSFTEQGARFVQTPVHHYFRPAGTSQFFRLPAIIRSAKQLLQLWWRIVIRG